MDTASDALDSSGTRHNAPAPERVPHPSGVAREVLLADAIADLVRLLDRADTQRQEFDESHLALENSLMQLSSELNTVDAQLARFSERARNEAVQHIVVAADGATRQILERHSQAIVRSSDAAVQAALTAALQRWDARTGGRWTIVLTHASAASIGAALLALVQLFAPLA